MHAQGSVTEIKFQQSSKVSMKISISLAAQAGQTISWAKNFVKQNGPGHPQSSMNQD